jgi:hypothetical protein
MAIRLRQELCPRLGLAEVLIMPSLKKTSAASQRGGKGTKFLEHRVATPRADLFVLRLGKSKSGATLRETEKSDALIDGIIKATLRPGMRRDIVFRSNKDKRVYAYSIFPGDVTKIVREDANGKKTLGRVVHGKFKPLRSKAV